MAFSWPLSIRGFCGSQQGGSETCKQRGPGARAAAGACDSCWPSPMTSRSGRLKGRACSPEQKTQPLLRKVLRWGQQWLCEVLGEGPGAFDFRRLGSARPACARGLLARCRSYTPTPLMRLNQIDAGKQVLGHESADEHRTTGWPKCLFDAQYSTEQLLLACARSHGDRPLYVRAFMQPSFGSHNRASACFGGEPGRGGVRLVGLAGSRSPPLRAEGKQTGKARKRGCIDREDATTAYARLSASPIVVQSIRDLRLNRNRI